MMIVVTSENVKINTEKLRKLIKERGLTQKKFAEEAGVSRYAVKNALSSGKIKKEYLLMLHDKWLFDLNGIEIEEAPTVDPRSYFWILLDEIRKVNKSLNEIAESVKDTRS